MKCKKTMVATGIGMIFLFLLAGSVLPAPKLDKFITIASYLIGSSDALDFGPIRRHS